MAAARKTAESKTTDEQKGDALYVSAPIVVVKVEGNRVVHLFKGDVLPKGVTKESLENLQQLGFVSDEPQQ